MTKTLYSRDLFLLPLFLFFFLNQFDQLQWSSDFISSLTNVYLHNFLVHTSMHISSTSELF